MKLKKTLFASALLCAVVAAPLASDAAFNGGDPANDPPCCMIGSAQAQRLLPTLGGDTSFFASSSNDPPNVVFLLDNSTSMYEIPQPLGTFPNQLFLLSGNPTGFSGTATVGYTPAPKTDLDTQSCHANKWLEGRTRAGGSGKYSNVTSYPPYDPAFTDTYDGSKVYKYIEWRDHAPGGASKGTEALPGTYCKQYSNTTYSGLTTLNEQKWCERCLGEAGYYISPSAVTVNRGVSSAADTVPPINNILFSGNWLNFFPPKYVIARKVLTDFVSQNSSARLAVATYRQDAASCTATASSLQSCDGGQLVVAGSAGNVFSPGCGIAWTQQMRDDLVAAVRGIPFDNGGVAQGISTPLAETLFNIGQLLQGDASNGFWTAKFGATKWVRSSFTSKAATDSQRALCTACQAAAVVIITDGEPTGDNNVPYSGNAVSSSTTIRALNGNTDVLCGGASCGTDPYNNSTNRLADVAKMLANQDLNVSMTGIQNVNTYVIGLGTSDGNGGTAVPILQATAIQGQGQAYSADTASDLTDALNNAVLDFTSRATAFSSTAIQTLQVGSGSSALVPRFNPGFKSIWEGHLYRFDLFNEFVANTDKNGDGNKNGVFLVDKDGDIISENDRGEFLKSSGASTGQPAAPVWDAGAKLDARAWSSRKIYTAFVDKVSGDWKQTDFATILNDGTFAKLDEIIPYLGIQGGQGTAAGSVCARIAANLPGGLPLTQRQCAQTILQFVMGKDVLGEVSPAKSTGNRSHVLGDIFHSSPIMVDPPVDPFICSLGLHAQCASTIYGQQIPGNPVPVTPLVSYSDTKINGVNADAYQKWQRSQPYGSSSSAPVTWARKKLVLVGANDGMVHAFNAGETGTTPALDPTLPYPGYAYDKGTGEEEWAFVPPDQLPRLALMLIAGHQYYVDGDIMVRDVWVDGIGATSGKDGKKQWDEFRTVAVVSEREGGTHQLGLDVTDPAAPKFLWMWPKPCTPEEQAWGETWGQFAPKPPPIGPVLLETSDSNKVTRYSTGTEERWVVLLNGGHDAYNTRGRGFAMLDVWTGEALWKQFFKPGATDASASMQYAFPATAAMVDYNASGSDRYANDAFFDTAVLGDEGGQIWTLRFNAPGQLDASGLVTNWSFGRAFEPSTASVKTIADRQPIFTLAATTAQSNGALTAFVGSGDRAHVRSTGGGDCRPDELTSCIRANCTTKAKLTLKNGPYTYVSTFGGKAGAFGLSSGADGMDAPTQSATLDSSQYACQLGSASLELSATGCTSVTNFATNTPTTQTTFQCSGSTAATYACTEGTFVSPVSPNNVGLAATAGSGGKFLSVALLAASVSTTVPRSRAMNAPSDASGYDSSRLVTSELVDVTNVTASTAGVVGGTAAVLGAPGWVVSYGNVDEKTVTSATLLGGCLLWNSIIPQGGAGGCASGGSVLSNTYQADVISGAPNCADAFLAANTPSGATGMGGPGGSYSGAAYYRYLQRNVISPPPEAASTVAMGGGGSSLKMSALVIQPGSQEVTQFSVNTNTELLKMLYSIPLTADQHTCRHVDASKCP